MPSSTPSTEPTLDCPPGTVPGWEGEDGQPTSCINDDPEFEPTPDLDVDHPTDEPDLPADEPTTTTITEPLPDALPVTGAGTTLAWIAGGLLALGGVLVALARRRTPSPPGPDDSPEAEAAAIRAARRGFTHPADTD